MLARVGRAASAPTTAPAAPTVGVCPGVEEREGDGDERDRSGVAEAAEAQETPQKPLVLFSRIDERVVELADEVQEHEDLHAQEQGRAQARQPAVASHEPHGQEESSEGKQSPARELGSPGTVLYRFIHFVALEVRPGGGQGQPGEEEEGGERDAEDRLLAEKGGRRVRADGAGDPWKSFLFGFCFVSFVGTRVSF